MRTRPNGGGALNNADYMLICNLPDHFIDSLRVLFDILDTSRTGFVSFEQLAQKWRELPTSSLPPNFLECLRRVTPFSGMLTFERFLAGVRLSIHERRMTASHGAQMSNYQLHRVRSEGKLQEICPNFYDENFICLKGKKSSKKSLKSRNNNNNNCAHPAMGLNVLMPATTNFVNIQGDGNCLRLQKKKQYRSQPNISHAHQSDYLTVDDNYNTNKRSSKEAPEKKSTSDYGIVMRPKKGKNIRAPLPPPLVSETYVQKMTNGNLRHSTAGLSLESSMSSQQASSSSSSASSTKCGSIVAPNHIRPLSSSGMTDIQWRNSRLSAVNIPTPASSYNRGGEDVTPSIQPYSEELQPQVAKHERLLAEEFGIVQKGMNTTQNLMAWFEKRIQSLEKRKKMLDKGMVALDSAVHEQKLNFYRAQITELTRRMNTLIVSNEHGFPSYQNMTQQHDCESWGPKVATPPSSDNSTLVVTPINGVSGNSLQANQKKIASRDTTMLKNLKAKNALSLTAAIATPIVSTIQQQQNDVTNAKKGRTGSLGSSSVSSTRTNTSSSQQSSHNPSPEPTALLPHLQQNQIRILKQQQQRLVEELDSKSRLIEKLQREKRVHEMQQAQFFNSIDKPAAASSIRTPIPTTIAHSHRLISTMIPDINRKAINNTLL